MYYHCRELKYVKYDKVYPPPEEAVDDAFLPIYEWLGNHCGYSPQVWLARSSTWMTGYGSLRYTSRPVKRNPDGTWRSKRRIFKVDEILFGFENVQGFPVNYDVWTLLFDPLIQQPNESKKTFDEQNKKIVEALNRYIRWHEEEDAEGDKMDPELQGWVDNGKDLDAYLKNCLFVKNDQVVVPSLNLKAAKQIICCNEKQKKSLRKMGFIEDRIKIKNIRRSKW